MLASRFASAGAEARATVPAVRAFLMQPRLDERSPSSSSKVTQSVQEPTKENLEAVQVSRPGLKEEIYHAANKAQKGKKLCPKLVGGIVDAIRPVTSALAPWSCRVSTHPPRGGCPFTFAGPECSPPPSGGGEHSGPSKGGVEVRARDGVRLSCWRCRCISRAATLRRRLQ
jgi:hypothetical protein